MRVIQVETCGECPWLQVRACGSKTSCGQTQIQVQRPYAEDRVVERGSEPPEWCPLSTAQRVCKIIGSEIDFMLEVAECEIGAKAKDIWANPGDYWDVCNGTEGAYYKFLKFLWIEYPDGREVRLADII